MHFRFIRVGKTKDKNWKALEEEYLKRLSHFVKCTVSDIKEGRGPESAQIEGERILELLNQKSFVVLLDVAGRTVSSPELAKKIEEWQDRSLKEVAFIIGGPSGTSTSVGQKADFSLSLSFLTLTHEMARVVLLEQLYRAFTINKGFPYHK